MSSDLSRVREAMVMVSADQTADVIRYEGMPVATVGQQLGEIRAAVDALARAVVVLIDEREAAGE